MLIVGERINTTRRAIREAVEKRDANFIQEEAKRQLSHGAHFIDVNAGTSVRGEVEDLKWLVEVVQEALDVPLAIDSANVRATEAALKAHRGRALVNSITGESERLENYLPLIKEYDTLVVALTMDDSGMPEDLEGRLRIARQLAERLEREGISLEKVYFDVVIRPISVDQKQAVIALEAMRQVLREFPAAHCICGLSNVSFGLPKRRILNSTFLTLALASGLDAVILDPTDPGMMGTLYATQAILGRDDYCMRYIKAAREGKLT